MISARHLPPHHRLVKPSTQPQYLGNRTDPRGPSERKPCLSAGLAWENVSLGCSGAIFLPTWRQPVDRMKPHAEASRAETEFETQKDTDREALTQ